MAVAVEVPVAPLVQPEPIVEQYSEYVTPVALPVESEADAKAFIYQHESGNVACKINGGAINCDYDGHLACGIGQALPCQKLTAVCSLSDYNCQDTWFTNYMKQRYGTWAKAKEFWKCIGNCTNNYGTIYKSTTWW